MRFVFSTSVVVLWILSAVPSAQSPQTVFKGRPQVKVSEGGVERQAENIPTQSAPNLVVVISKIGKDFYWASRENVPLVEVDGGGAYVTYVAINGSGYIRVLKADMKKAAALVDDTSARFDYVEHLVLGLKSVTYYGLRQP